MTMGATTGVPLAVTLKMLARGRIAEHGVFTPEAAINPDGFFDELAPLGTPAFDSVDQLVAVTIA